MEITRVILGAHPQPMIKKIPDHLVRDRTITLNKMGQLTMFKDDRQEAREYINDILPHLCLGVPATTLRKMFWEAPQGSWFEFDYGKKILSLVTVKNPISK